MESQNTLKSRRHIASLDGLRGVAILMVLFCHFYDESAFLGLGILGAVLTKLAIAGSSGVDLFFVLSGF